MAMQVLAFGNSIGSKYYFMLSGIIYFSFFIVLPLCQLLSGALNNTMVSTNASAVSFCL